MSEENKELKDKLFYQRKNAFEECDSATINAVSEYAEGYKGFLDASKTEREAVKTAIALAENEGFVPYDFGDKIVIGGKYYYNNRGKSVYFFRIGTDPVENGVYISAAHIDSPRLDLKQNPLYEDSGMGFFKTHYYGGIKKYQWTTIPLALHGVVTRNDGSQAEIVIGEDEKDPVLYINDLLPHLAKEQMQKPLSQGITGEQLNILLGTEPFGGKCSENAVKLNLVKMLYDKFGIKEEDFQSAELCCVPAYRARDIGLDRSLIGAYGHDDRVCAYAALTALFDTENEKKTVITILADKEEIGSEGTSGMQTMLFLDILDEIASAFCANVHKLRRNSRCLSADVNAAFDPNYSEPYERFNSSYLNGGVCLTKYTGSGGKSGTNDASSEFVAYVRNVFDENKVIWQSGELGKVDAGGGGTVAKYIAKYNIETVDLGVPVISMHAPYEVISKLDLFMTYKAFKSFNQ